MALVAVSIFGVNIGAFYQCVVMTAVLAVFMFMLQAFKQIEFLEAGRSMLRGVQCLLLTSYVALSLQQA
jgi:hypothetical protein